MMRELPALRHVLVASAHPDDESFGLGSVLAKLSDVGTRVSVLCFTRGERSTLMADSRDLAALRSAELTAAAASLGIEQTDLLAYPDGALSDVSLDELSTHVLQRADGVDALLVFDEGGVTGHPDHIRATQASRMAADTLRLPVLAWAIPQSIAGILNREFGTGFVGREEHELDVMLSVDRARQLRAIRCHHSQSHDNPVLWRRLELQGSIEWLRLLGPEQLPARSGITPGTERSSRASSR